MSPVMAELDGISFRPMIAADLGTIPIQHQGEPDEIVDRIARLGSSGMLAFDGDRHVAQLQFREWVPNVRSPDGLWDPLYWAEFPEVALAFDGPALNVFCYHVGQLEEGDARDPRYQGRGLGKALLREFVDWADRAGFEAIVAKGVPPYSAVMGFMGGQPAGVYEAHGFEIVRDWVDPDLREIVVQKGLAPEGVALDDAARITCCVHRRIRKD